MASRTTRSDWLHTLVVTLKTRRMPRRHRLEELRRRRKVLVRGFDQRLLAGRNARCRFRDCRRRRVADRTVIELRWIIRRSTKTRIYKMCDGYGMFRTTLMRCNNVLMNVVRKDRGELTRARFYREGKQWCTPRSGARVAAGAKRGLVSYEEVLAMTTRTGRVAGKLRYIREASGGDPVRRRDLVTRGTIKTFVRRGRVRETIALLRRRTRQKTYRGYRSEKDCHDYRGTPFHFTAQLCPSHTGTSRTNTSHLSTRFPGSGTGSDRIAFLSAPISTSQAHM